MLEERAEVVYQSEQSRPNRNEEGDKFWRVSLTMRREEREIKERACEANGNVSEWVEMGEYDDEILSELKRECRKRLRELAKEAESVPCQCD